MVADGHFPKENDLCDTPEGATPVASAPLLLGLRKNTTIDAGGAGVVPYGVPRRTKCVAFCLSAVNNGGVFPKL